MAELDGNGVHLVVGANRGIGLALVTAQLANPAARQVIAASRPGCDARELQQLAERHGNRLRRVDLDVTEPRSLADFERCTPPGKPRRGSSGSSPRPRANAVVAS